MTTGLPIVDKLTKFIVEGDRLTAKSVLKKAGQLARKAVGDLETPFHEAPYTGSQLIGEQARPFPAALYDEAADFFVDHPDLFDWEEKNVAAFCPEYATNLTMKPDGSIALTTVKYVGFEPLHKYSGDIVDDIGKMGELDDVEEKIAMLSDFVFNLCKHAPGYADAVDTWLVNEVGGHFLDEEAVESFCRSSEHEHLTVDADMEEGVAAVARFRKAKHVTYLQVYEAILEDEGVEATEEEVVESEAEEDEEEEEEGGEDEAEEEEAAEEDEDAADEDEDEEDEEEGESTPPQFRRKRRKKSDRGSMKFEKRKRQNCVYSPAQKK